MRCINDLRKTKQQAHTLWMTIAALKKKYPALDESDAYLEVMGAMIFLNDIFGILIREQEKRDYEGIKGE